MTIPLGARVAAVTVILLGALAVMVGVRQWPLMTGREVVLATEPVDPRDLLRGDYVALAYGPSRLSGAEMALPDGVAPGDTVHVTLAGPDAGGHWRAAAVSLEPPGGPGPFLRGRVSQRWVDSGSGGPSVTMLAVDYGIESYFVPEDVGRDLEDLVRQGGRLSVAVAVDDRGRAVIAGLVVDGRRITREGLL